jgi:hypothetical protein
MSDTAIALLMLLMYAQGVVVGYIFWAPETSFKRGLMDGLTFKFLWSKK